MSTFAELIRPVGDRSLPRDPLDQQGPSLKVAIVGRETAIGGTLRSTLRGAMPAHEVVGLRARPAPDQRALAEAFAGAHVVVDIGDAARGWSSVGLAETVAATRRLVDAAEAAAVGHLVFVSSVGLGRSSEAEHFTARLSAESIVEASTVPHSVVRTTQLFEEVRLLARSRHRVDPGRGRLLLQPIAASDVADAVAAIATRAPRGRVVTLAGPERFHLDDLLRSDELMRFFHREAWIGRSAQTSGSDPVSVLPLLPGGRAEITPTRFGDWATARSAGPHEHGAPVPRPLVPGPGGSRGPQTLPTPSSP